MWHHLLSSFLIHGYFGKKQDGQRKERRRDGFKSGTGNNHCHAKRMESRRKWHFLWKKVFRSDFPPIENAVWLEWIESLFVAETTSYILHLFHSCMRDFGIISIFYSARTSPVHQRRRIQRQEAGEERGHKRILQNNYSFLRGKKKTWSQQRGRQETTKKEDKK